MANHNLPTISSTYANFVTELDSRLDDISIHFDPALTTATNLATGAIRWTSASSKWEKWSGTAWADLAATYAISISGSAGSVANGVYTTGTYNNPAWITGLAGTKISGAVGSADKLSTARNINGTAFDGSAAITITANTSNSLTLINDGTGAVSGTTFNGGSAVKISYNSVGAPSITGANASGSWAISVTGNAATATKLAASVNINGSAFDGSAAITVTANTGSSLTLINDGTGAASGTTFNGGSAVKISYNSVGAPSTTGTNATGNSWAIGITGNAATATSSTKIANATGWNVTPSGTSLYFNYNGTNVGVLDSSGNLTVIGNVTAYGTV